MGDYRVVWSMLYNSSTAVDIVYSGINQKCLGNISVCTTEPQADSILWCPLYRSYFLVALYWMLFSTLPDTESRLINTLFTTLTPLTLWGQAVLEKPVIRIKRDMDCKHLPGLAVIGWQREKLNWGNRLLTVSSCLQNQGRTTGDTPSGTEDFQTEKKLIFSTES